MRNTQNIRTLRDRSKDDHGYNNIYFYKSQPRLLHGLQYCLQYIIDEFGSKVAEIIQTYKLLFARKYNRNTRRNLHMTQNRFRIRYVPYYQKNSAVLEQCYSMFAFIPEEMITHESLIKAAKNNAITLRYAPINMITPVVAAAVVFHRTCYVEFVSDDILIDLILDNWNGYVCYLSNSLVSSKTFEINDEYDALGIYDRRNNTV